jgi:hypothetical protein
VDRSLIVRGSSVGAAGPTALFRPRRPVPRWKVTGHWAGEGMAVMTHIAGEVTINAPVDEVFDLVADECNEPWYNPRIVRVEKVSEGPVGTGTRFVAEPKSMGSKGEMTLKIVEYDRPHRLHNLVRSSYMHVDGTLTFDKVEGGTRLRWDWDMGLVGTMRMLSPVLALIGPGWERRNWVGLKEYMESGRR